MPARIQCEVRVGAGKNSQRIGNENRHLFGPVEGWWFIGLFWFAIAVLMYNLAWPWVYETATGRSWRFSQNVPVSQTTVVSPHPTIVVPPVVVVQPPQAVSQAPAEKSVWDDPRNR